MTEPLRHECCPSRICATCTVDSTARMGTGRSQIQAADEGRGPPQSRDRPEDQLLVELRRPSVNRTSVEVGIIQFEFRWGKDMAPPDG